MGDESKHAALAAQMEALSDIERAAVEEYVASYLRVAHDFAPPSSSRCLTDPSADELRWQATRLAVKNLKVLVDQYKDREQGGWSPGSRNSPRGR